MTIYTYRDLLCLATGGDQQVERASPCLWNSNSNFLARPLNLAAMSDLRSGV